MKITDDILDGYNKLGRSKNTWAFTFEVYHFKTQFRVINNDGVYMIYLNQNYMQQGIWEETILLTSVYNTDELENLFTSLTSGEFL